jgi:hypothetical protein
VCLATSCVRLKPFSSSSSPPPRLLHHHHHLSLISSPAPGFPHLDTTSSLLRRFLATSLLVNGVPCLLRRRRLPAVRASTAQKLTCPAQRRRFPSYRPARHISTRRLPLSTPAASPTTALSIALVLLMPMR